MQRSGAVAARLGHRDRAAAVGRPPATRLVVTAVAALAVAALALLGFGRATAPRGDAGVSLAVAGTAGAVTVRNGDMAPFSGSLVIGSGAGAQTLRVDLRANETLDVPLPGGVPCTGGLDVRLVASGASAAASPVMLRLPCGSRAP